MIGSGLAGLSSAYYLKKAGFDVTVISSKDPGASRIFAGILYRYPGRWGKKSKFADDAYPMSKALIEEVEAKTKKRVILSTGVVKKFSKRLKRFLDVEMDGDDGQIKDGLTVDMNAYLDGLKELIGKERFIEKEIESLSEIEGLKVVACGHGVKKLLNPENLIYRKGQQYVGQMAYGAQEYGTHVGKGHISFIGDGKVCLGSTYEREFDHLEIDKDYAEKEIRSRIEPWYGSLEDVKEKSFFSGVRVGRADSYLPWVDQIDDETFVFAGLGSRGLLYHAYYGQILADLINSKKL